MGLISKTVKIKWNSMTKKHYESLGYTYTKMYDEFEVRVEDLSKGSNIKVYCICDSCKKDLSWTYRDYNNQVKDNGKTYCKKCAMKLYGTENYKKTRLKNGKSFYDWCIESNRQDVLDRWDYELNDCLPSEVNFSSNTPRWFKCLTHPEHKSELKVISRLTSKNQEGSIECNQCNSVAQYILDNFPNKKLEEVWDYEKNEDLDPWSVNKSSRIKAWIFCQEKDYHGSYEMRCSHFTQGERCPYCTNRNGKVHSLDSLKQYIIDKYGEEFFNVIWSDKNSIDPSTIAPNSTIICWWNCPEGSHEPYQRDCHSSFKVEFRCPKCVEERKESIIEEKTRLYLENLGYEVKTEYNCSLIPKNPKTKMLMPFDNEVILENGKHLIIEVHGRQHYGIHFYKNRYSCSEEEAKKMLYQRQLYDRYKRIKCVQASYEYLEIPYLYFNKNDTYKKIIYTTINKLLKS